MALVGRRPTCDATHALSTALAAMVQSTATNAAAQLAAAIAATTALARAVASTATAIIAASASRITAARVSVCRRRLLGPLWTGTGHMPSVLRHEERVLQKRLPRVSQGVCLWHTGVLDKLSLLRRRGMMAGRGQVIAAYP